MALIRRALATVLTGLLLLAPVPVHSEPATETHPIAVRPPVTVSTEMTYAAYPSAVRQGLVGQRDWVAYRHASGHATGDGSVRVRWRDDGESWSDPVTVVPDAAGAAMSNPAGMTADTTGRVYLGVMRAHSTGSASATDYSTWITWHDPTDPPGTWAPLRQVPMPAALVGTSYGLVASAVHVHDGEALVAGYGLPASGRWTSYVMAYNPATGVFTQRGAFGHPTRNFAEPQLATLADGRLIAVTRSDTTTPYYSYLFAQTSSNAGVSWSTPATIVQHGSGMPTVYVRPNGEVAVVYRGFSEGENPSQAYPLRVAMLRPDGAPANPATEQGIDLTGGDQRLFLYGAWLAETPNRPAELLYALEGVGGQSGSAATVYSLVLDWLERSN